MGRFALYSAVIAAALAAVPVVHSQYQAPAPPPVSTPTPLPADPNVPQSNDQNAQPQQQLSDADLDTLLAPISLYPDSLLSQILMASTYPLEVVQAERFVTANPNLTGDSLANALVQQPWDPSVKSLTNFPNVLQMMDDKLDWTVQLGNAFLAQQPDVMNSVQRLRAQAQAAGNLQTNEQQKVQTLPPEANSQPSYIVIENAQPDYTYVPVYDPLYVYGTWRYTDRHPWFWRPHDYVPSRGIWWGPRYPYGPAWGYAWGRPDWRQHDIDVDIHRHEKYDIHVDRTEIIRRERDINVRDGKGVWQHDPAHRDGITYGDVRTAERYGGRAPQADVQRREQYRGRPDAPAAAREVRDAQESKSNPRTTPPRNDNNDVNRNNVRDQHRDDNNDVNRTQNRDTNTRRDEAPKTPAPQPDKPKTEDRRPAPAPAPAPSQAPAAKSDNDRPANPRTTPPAGSGVRGSSGGGDDARADSARGRASRSTPSAPAPRPAPSAPPANAPSAARGSSGSGGDAPGGGGNSAPRGGGGGGGGAKGGGGAARH